MLLALLAGCGGDQAPLGGDSTCREYLLASAGEQERAVRRVAAEAGTAVEMTNLVRSSVHVYCANNPESLLARALDDARLVDAVGEDNDEGGSSTLSTEPTVDEPNSETTHSFVLRTRRGYDYRVELDVRPAVAPELGDPGKVVLRYAEQWPIVTFTNTTADREAPMGHYDVAHLVVHVYVRIPDQLAETLDRADLGSPWDGWCNLDDRDGEGPCYAMQMSRYFLGDPLAIGGSRTLDQQVGLPQPPLVIVPEEYQSEWIDALGATPTFVQVSVSSGGYSDRPLGNEIEDYECLGPASEGVLALLGPDGEVDLSSTKGCRQAQLLWIARLWGWGLPGS